MEVFAATVAEGSFSAAGRCLGLTPSAVSRTIDRIEARLGVRLLLRSTRALALTAEGEAYLRSAKRILADLDDRSEEHTSELQSLMRISYAVFCLKKKKQTSTNYKMSLNTVNDSTHEHTFQHRTRTKCACD